KKMYALRDVTGTVESIPLIAASVMSKKLASGCDAILLDVTVGEGAFMKNMDSARELAGIMVEIGNRLGRDTRAVLSDMGEPLGLAVGNALEVKEAIESLHGRGPEDLMELCYTAGSIMLVQAKCAKNRVEAREKLEEAINSGAAFEKFLLMVEAQGGDKEYILHPEKFPLAHRQIPIYSKKAGYVHKLNALEIGISSMKLGGGRETLEDTIDMSAGIILNKKIGDKVEKGELLCTAHTNKKDIDDVLKEIEDAYVIEEGFCARQPVIKEIIEK
ncbi:MAG: thymidine phosphorylase, partial [Bacilli bacterium]|nr:thymidine phosphorylase [Bacilli bacterium]